MQHMLIVLFAQKAMRRVHNCISGVGLGPYLALRRWDLSITIVRFHSGPSSFLSGLTSAHQALLYGCAAGFRFCRLSG